MVVGGDGGVKRRGSICNEQVVTMVYFRGLCIAIKMVYYRGPYVAIIMVYYRGPFFAMKWFNVGATTCTHRNGLVSWPHIIVILDPRLGTPDRRPRPGTPGRGPPAGTAGWRTQAGDPRFGTPIWGIQVAGPRLGRKGWWPQAVKIRRLRTPGWDCQAGEARRITIWSTHSLRTPGCDARLRTPDFGRQFADSRLGIPGMGPHVGDP
jgi:hypothetical protein